MTELKQLLTDISRAIVDFPDSVNVIECDEGDTVVFTLHVAESDMGKVIGKHGKNARSIRAVMKAAAATVGKKAVVEIAE
ncbi:MAG: KH domain-containing protein [Clostridia bacterium]|nr:KH domain-containing protein [Clostridia bacterium]